MSKKVVYLLLLLSTALFSQENKQTSVFLDANYVYVIAKTFVTPPNFIELRDSSSYVGISEGTLSFSELRLINNT